MQYKFQVDERVVVWGKSGKIKAMNCFGGPNVYAVAYDGLSADDPRKIGVEREEHIRDTICSECGRQREI